jgi:hypothetical protein
MNEGVADRMSKTCAAMHTPLPLWVISGQIIVARNATLSALVQKRTFAGAIGLSAKCQ